MEHPIVLFDGVCNFCNFWVKFIIKHDKNALLKFAAIQSPIGQSILASQHIDIQKTESVIFIEKGNVYTQSSAALHICKHLNGGWKLLYGLLIFPKFLRNGVYRMIAKNRYKWFGKKAECMIPTDAEKNRFLESNLENWP